MPKPNNQTQENDEVIQENNTDTPEQVEVYKDVERFKLGIWLAKTFSLFVLAMATFFISMYGYVAVTTQVLGDLAGFASVLGGFFEVIKVVIAP